MRTSSEGFWFPIGVFVRSSPLPFRPRTDFSYSNGVRGCQGVCSDIRPEAGCSEWVSGALAIP